MNNKITFSSLILIIAPFFFNCSGPAVKENESVKTASIASFADAGDDKYFIYIKESVVAWKGSMVFSENTHKGFVSISKGELMVAKDQLVGGTVDIDMKSIENEDHDRDNGLINHLKDPDFFDVEKFPGSTFAITKVAQEKGENRKITGNLTIKGITHPVTFPAKIEVKGGVVKANGKLVIDRTLWDIRYNSGKFFDNLADETISDSIEFDIKIVARK